MYYFYVLYSLKDGRLYKGSSSDLLRRLQQHNNGRTTSTKNRRPFILLYFEEYPDKALATKREAFVKTLAGGTALRQLLVEKFYTCYRRINNLVPSIHKFRKRNLAGGKF